jgi:hypothetical protein
MPELKSLDDAIASAGAGVTFATKKDDADKDWSELQFEDEESRAFYRSLSNIATLVPESYFAMEKKKTKRKVAPPLNKTASYDELDESNFEWMAEVDDEIMWELEQHMEANEEEDAMAAALVKPKDEVDEFFQGLLDIIDKEQIDAAAVRFCELQSKNKAALRKRLIQTLLDAPRSRLDVLP